jgi:Flp pilus assembly protein TadB/Mg-chelatase subunit ChlD
MWVRAGLAVAVAVGSVGLGSFGLAADPALAAPGGEPGVAITAAEATPGQVTLTLAVRDLPAGTTLDAGNVTVDADGTRLDVLVGGVNSVAGRAARRAVVLVLDTSGSMKDGGRLTAARAAALRYADAVPADVALGVVTFADRPVVRLSPTTDRSVVDDVIRGISANGETAIFDAVDRAGTLLAAGYDVARIVVLTDGADTSSTANATTVARALSRNRVTVDAVSYGAGAGDAQLDTLARATGGSVVAAADSASLDAVFGNLAANLSGAVVVSAPVPVELAGRSATIRATLTLPGHAAATATAPVTFHESTLTPAQTKAPPGWLLLLAVGTLAVALLVLGLLAVFGITGRSRRRQRLRQLEHHWAPAAAAGPPTTNRRQDGPVVRAMLSASERAISRQGSHSRLQLQLDQAGMDLRPAEWALIRLGIALGAGVLLALAPPWWLGLLLGAAGGWIGTGVYRSVRASRRAQRFAEMLPDSLQLVVSALRSGFSLPQAVDAVVREGDEPVSTEFGRALAETRLGADLGDALVHTAERNRNEDLAWLVMAIRVQREVGGNLSEVVETTVETMRERGRLRRFVRALSAEGRLSAWILTAIPVGLGLFMFTFRGEYLRPLYTTGLGVMMLGAGVVFMGIGVFWMSRLIKLEV